MAKHEVKISRTKFILSLVLAIAISLGGGVEVGYYLAKYYATKSSSQPAPIVQSTLEVDIESDESEEEPKKLSKDEQINAVKGSLKQYYDINSSILSRVVNESLKESQSTGKSQETIFKDKLYKVYEGIALKNFLNTMKDYIYKGNLKATYYSDFYREQDGSQVKSVEVTEYKDNLIKAKAVITNNVEFYSNEKDTLPTASEFFGEYKGKGITQQQYTKMLNLKPSKIKVLETLGGKITLENSKDKWYISDFETPITSTEIKEVTLKGKTIKIEDFIRQYLSK